MSVVVETGQKLFISDFYASGKDFSSEIEFIVHDHAHLTIVQQESSSGIAQEPRKIKIVAHAYSHVSYFFAVQGCSTELMIDLDLQGEQSSIDVRGIYASRQAQNILLTTRQLHNAPHTKSSVQCKGLLFDEAKVHYNGTIAISKDARDSQASQHHATMLVGKKSRATSIPALEIKNDRVHCKHGSASGPCDEATLVYLMSRGFDENDARLMIHQAFLSSIFEHREPLSVLFTDWIATHIKVLP